MDTWRFCLLTFDEINMFGGGSLVANGHSNTYVVYIIILSPDNYVGRDP